ncbi:hypothetical protein MMC30_007469 [Trapelia coarctata]|nr:hypothetical protein [Trapelia coarctata]
MPPSSDSSLYGIPRPARAPKNPISTSTSLSFTSHLTSLLSATRPTTNTSSSARPRPSKRPAKDDIFTSHNRGAKKRAAADISSSPSLSTQNHNAEIGTVDSDTLHKSKRKMEEKARLYAAMKRGDYIPPSHKTRGAGNGEGEPLVDFDRKWAEEEAAGKDANYDTSSGSDDGASDTEAAPEDKEMVEYTDEFNRLRRGTKAEAARESRRRLAATHAEEELQSMSARPAAPAKLIYGDTIQAAAFNPDAPIQAAMEELARKRDRSATPPDEVHYDASKEVRSKGVGFYAFSGDKETRAKEMAALEAERKETERRKVEREEKVRKRREEVERRRREVASKRGEKLADAFLDELGGILGEGAKGET